MRRALSLSLLALMGCTHGPSLPTTRALAFHVCVPAAEVSINGPFIDTDRHWTGPDGSTGWNFISHDAFAFRLRIRAAGYQEYNALVLLKDGPRVFLIGECRGRLIEPERQERLRPLVWELP